MNKCKQFGQGFLGAIAGLVIGMLGQVFFGQDESLDGRPLFPVEGANIGVIVGFTFGYMLGNYQLKGRLKNACIGAACGALIESCLVF
jgi:hypothetical protein